MEVIELIEEMRSICETLRCNGTRIRFVPTMGALHAGHASLIEAAAANNVMCVNPTNHAGRVIRDSANDATLGRGGDDGDRNRQADLSNCEPQLGEQLQQPESHLAARILNSALEIASESTSSSSSTSVGRQKGKKVAVIVSIFVNPKQFNNPDDFVNYPKTIQTDLDICRKLNVDYVFAPSISQMYPELPIGTTKPSTSTKKTKEQQDPHHCMVVPPCELSNVLEGKSRPGHFKGMLTVVCKLFNIIKPHEAYFGEKDYQQVILVSKMVNDLNMDVKIKPIKTVREPDQLPMSSRNVRLSERQRKAAPIIFGLLADTKLALEAEHDDAKICTDWIPSTLMASMLTCLSINLDDEISNLVEVDYLELRCAKDLSEICYNDDFNGFDCKEGCVQRQLQACEDIILKTRLLVSIILDDIRLLDNIDVELNLYH